MAKEHLVNDDTIKETNKILNKLVAATRESSGVGVTEYGVAYVVGQSDSNGYRCYRKNGILVIASSTLNGDSTFPYKFTPGVGTTACVNDYEECTDFPNFNPAEYTTKAGKFRSFERFYYGTQYIGVYEIHWVCAEKLYDWYKLPRAFYWQGEAKWNYVDIGCYEAAEEISGSTTYMVSKPDLYLSHNKTIQSFYNYANNWNSTIDTDEEYYAMITISSWTEILTPIIEVMIASRNVQNTTTGYLGCGWLYEYYCPIVGYKTDTSAGTTTLYIAYTGGGTSGNSTTIKTGCTVGLSTAGTAATTDSTDDNYAQCVAASTVTGTINDATYTHTITIDKVLDGTEGYAYVCGRPWKTGQCDFDRTGAYGWRNETYASCLKGNSGAYTNSGSNCYPFKILGIENVWGNMWTQISDIYICDYVPYVCNDLTNWSYMTSTANITVNAYFDQVGYSVSMSNGNPTELGTDDEHPDVKLTTAVGGSTSSYYADYYWQASGARIMYAGGSLYYNTYVGLFCFNLNNAPGYSSWGCGSRLTHYRL